MTEPRFLPRDNSRHDICMAPGCDQPATRQITTAAGGNWREGRPPDHRTVIIVCQRHEDEVMADYEEWPQWYVDLTDPPGP
jgi:hypothetical protein